MKKISYAITVNDELEEFKHLTTHLVNYTRPFDEIVIQQDAKDEDDAIEKAEELRSYILDLTKLYPNIKRTVFPLNGDFSAFKNNLTKHCKGDFIFQIDADEIPRMSLIENLPTVLEDNDIELIYVPRENLVEGITDEHVQKWGWRLDNKDRINYPDYQGRIYKNEPDRIKWVGKVHERIDGFKMVASLPPNETWELLHHKDIIKQEQQNKLYSKM